MINSVSYPEIAKTHCHFSDTVYSFMEKRTGDLQEIKISLEHPQSEDEVIADLFVLNQVIDNSGDVENIKYLYPILSKYNHSKNPNIQTLLAGVYRKIQVPDAFGPLMVMLIQNAINPPEDCGFDPNEEIGGAILDYLA